MLEGLKVIEMSTYVAAPGAGGMLRDWGAEVIKVEPLSGCPMRSFFEGTKSKLEIVGNPIFSLDNRGKKGMTINTSNEKGADIVSLIFGEKYYTDKQIYLHFKKIHEVTKKPNIFSSKTINITSIKYNFS